MMGTDRPVYLAGCSSWGMMEASLRNLIRPGKRVLNCCCGAFSDRWHDVALACGYEADALRVPWGHVVEPDMLKAALRNGKYDLVTIVHSETSTGVLNPLQNLARIVSAYEETLLVADVVSSYSAMELRMDEWGVDVMLAGTQKALALPPGMTVCSVSGRALKRAQEIPCRGFYFDFLEYERNAEKGMTITTPCIPIVMGLHFRTGEINKTGLAQRYASYQKHHNMVEEWGEKSGWRPLPPRGFRSPSLNCLLPPEGLEASRFVELLKEKDGFIIDGGYGELKGKCIRVSNMGVKAQDDLLPLLEAMARHMR